MGNSYSKPVVCSQYPSHIPPAFQFSRERHMVIVSSMIKNSLLCFPTQQSYERYKNNKSSEVTRNLDEDALGIPLFQFCRSSAMRIIMTRQLNSRIYKYVVQELKKNPPHPDAEIALKNDHFVVYKMLFCEVYTRNYPGMRGGYQLKITTPDGIIEIDMVQHIFHSGIDTKLGPWNVKWKNMGFDRMHLIAMHNDEPNLLDDDETRARKAKRARTRIDDATQPLCAKFIPSSKFSFPRIIERVADVYVGEIDIETDVASYGLGNVPWYSQVVACMSLVMYQHQIDNARQR